uniref:Reverse transcriptase domain-containing protein n=1 Tax=Tanacetum cinerariifolium TaxID=118510 RepID=A0A6L2LE51_TANCI|nr:hypothetical protein [Tanacetum cinerariifolium]
MLDEITLESLTEEQFECFIEYYRENYSEDYKSDLENLKEVYKMMNGGVEYPRTQNASPSEIKEPYDPLPRMDSYEQPSCLGLTFVGETLRKSDQMHQTFEKSSLAMTPYDEPIGDLDMMEDEMDNPNPQSTIQVLPSFKVYTPPVTYPKEVEETIGIPIEVEPFNQTQLNDLVLSTYNHDTPLNNREIPSVDELEPQLLPNFSPLDVNLRDKRGTGPPINPYSLASFRMKVVKSLTIHTPPSPHVAYFYQNVGSKDRPPILAMGRYDQWRPRFLRYIDTKSNGDALRKCILEGPYKPTTVAIPAVAATNNSLAYQKEVNEIRAERIAKSENPLALVDAAQQYPDNYYQAPKPQRSYAPTPQQSSSTRSNASTRHKGKENAKPVTPPFESGSDEDRMQEDYMYHKEKMLLCKQAEKGVPLQAEQADWLEDTDEEIDEQELEVHYSYMAKIQEVLPTDFDINAEPLVKVRYNDDYNVFANDKQHSEQSEPIINTCVVEMVDSNVIPDSSDMYDNDD